jgi:hypothetical protein
MLASGSAMSVWCAIAGPRGIPVLRRLAADDGEARPEVLDDELG